MDPEVRNSPEFLPQPPLDELLSELQGRLRVIDESKHLAEFIPVGLTEDEIGLLDHWPEGRGLLGLLVKDLRPLRLASIAEHAESSGFPAGHPPMESFLGVPVRVRDEVFGNLYLTNKRGGGEFTEDDEAALLALGAAAGVAVENARLYEATRRSQRWLQASAEVTPALLSGTDPGEVLARVTSQARALSDADLAILVLPDEEGAVSRSPTRTGMTRRPFAAWSFQSASRCPGRCSRQATP